MIAEIEERKERNGYAPNPYCTACHGSGWLHPADRDGLVDYSKVVPCDAPGCLVENKRQYQSGSAYVRSRGVGHKNQTFANFKSVLGVGETLKAFKSIAIGNPDKPFLLVYGVTGNGKTHLCEAAAAELLKAGRDVLLYPVADLCAELHESISSNTVEQKVNRLKKVEILFLDDYLTEYGSPWEEEKLEEIIAYRYRAYLVTVVTMNKNIEDIPERLQSRFSDESMSRMIWNQAPDHRRMERGKIH